MSVHQYIFWKMQISTPKLLIHTKVEFCWGILPIKMAIQFIFRGALTRESILSGRNRLRVVVSHIWTLHIILTMPHYWQKSKMLPREKKSSFIIGKPHILRDGTHNPYPVRLWNLSISRMGLCWPLHIIHILHGMVSWHLLPTTSPVTLFNINMTPWIA